MTSDTWRLHVLGAFRLEHDGRVVRLARRKVASLLVYLILHPQEHARVELATLFWGDFADSEALNSLRTALSVMRSAVGADALIADGDSVRLNPTLPLWVDAQAFQSSAARFLADAAGDLSPSFIDLYKGDLLPGFFDDWIAPQRERLHALYLDVLLHMVQRLRAQSEYERAVAFAQRVLTIDPSNERAHQHIMFCQVALGDRSAALKQYELCRQALADDLGVEPMAETTALRQWITGRPAHAPALAAQVTNLPIPLSSFIGREGETAEVKRLLARSRLLTLVGPGGSGKTRLAIQVATDLVDAFADGVWFSDLSAVQDPDQVAPAVARTLRVEAPAGAALSDLLAAFLRQRNTLLVLDNCEHLVAACAELAETILTAAPQVKLLATSREILDLPGEVVYQAPPMATPAVVPASLAELAGFEATRLFIERATAVDGEMALADQDAPAVVAVCRQLDGMPLAIELAAARVRLLSVGQIAALLHDRFQLLASGGLSRPTRQSSLRAAIDWSYDLLSPDEQALLRRLAVFVGGFGLAGAAAIAEREESATVDLLARLVDKSLVIVDRTGGERRYRLTETIRLYAWERLGEAGEREAVVHGYIAFLSRLVEEAGDRFLRGETQVDRRVMAEYDNIRSAMRWCRQTGEIEQGMRIATPLWCLNKSEDIGEWAGWLEALLAAPADVPAVVRGQALAAAATASRVQGDFERAMALAEESLALCQATGDKASIAFAALCVGRSAFYMQKVDIAKAFLERSLALYREIGYEAAAIWSLLFLANALQAQGDGERALALTEEGVKLSRDMNQTWGICYGLRVLAQFAQRRGDSATDVALSREALAVCMRNENTRDAALSFFSLADALTVHGQAERAAILWGVVSAVSDVFHIHVGSWPQESRFIIPPGDPDPHLAALRAQLGESVFSALVAKGRAMSFDEAVAYALSETDI